MERPLSEADVHVVRAILSLLPGDGQREPTAAEANERARRELRQAFRQDATHVLGRAVSHFLLGERADLAITREVCARHPSQWLAWAVLASALDGANAESREERSAALARARSLAGANPAVSPPPE